jgi:uncharacterized protein YggU (UPF0235/DUF167 family)
VRPGASRSHVGGRYDGPHGPALVVTVTARPVDGRATAAVLAAVADALDLPSRDVAIRSGTRSRDKLITVRSADPGLPSRVAALRDGSS